RRSSEIGLAQLEAHHRFWRNGRGRAFDSSAVWTAADRRMIYSLGGTAAAGGKAPGDHGALRYRIHLAIRAAKRGQKKNASLKVRGIANGRNRSINSHPWLRKRGQRSSDHHGSSVLNADRCWRNGNTHPLENIGQTLVGENGLLPVARSGQAHHNSITH